MTVWMSAYSHKRTFEHSYASIRVVSLGDLLNEITGIRDCYDLRSGMVGNFAAKLMFEGHDQLYRVKTVGSQVIDEARAVRHFPFVDAQVVGHDHPDALGDVVAHSRFLECAVPESRNPNGTGLLLLKYAAGFRSSTRNMKVHFDRKSPFL